MEFPAVISINVSGTPHAFMALIEIEAELKKHLEPSKQKAEERIDGLSAIVRETTQTLNDWDSETEKSVSVLHKARDEQVSLSKLHCMFQIKYVIYIFSYNSSQVLVNHPIRITA